MPYQASDRLIQARIAAFRKELATLGWLEGSVFQIIERWAGDNLDAVRVAARELVDQGLDVILTTGSRVVPIVQRAAGATPIVFVGVSDPVGQGFVASLARPGGNTTGFSLQEFDGENSPLVGKLFEIVSDLGLDLRRVALLYNPDNPASRFSTKTFEQLAQGKGLTAVHLRIQSESDIERELSAFASEAGGAVILPSDLTLLGLRYPIVDLLMRHKLPAVFSDRSFVETGGLVSYSSDRMDQFRRAAAYIDRILRGAKAGDLPIQQPVLYELVVNLRSARSLGVTIPATLLARADDVID